VAVIIGGTGDGKALQPYTGNAWQLPGTFQDPVTGDLPETLVAAGNASLLGTGYPDLIGIAGDSTSPDDYTLDLFTYCLTCTGEGATGYKLGTKAVLSAQAPGGDTWHNYQLATAQPGGQAVLFALDNTTGALWESANPSPAHGPCPDYGQATCTVIGTPNSTWTNITVPWGSNPPALLSADINSAGNTELWAESGGTTATAYTVSGSTLSTESTTTIAQPYNQWPLADGTGNAAAADTIAGKDAILNGGATWTDGTGTIFANYITLDGTGYLTPPAGTIPSSAATPKISIWFRTTTPDGVLVSLQRAAISSGPTLSGGYDPVLYIGTDGKLYGEWWNGAAAPAVAATVVDDGIWHHAWLTSYGNSQTLYLDNQPGVQLSGTTSLAFANPTNLTIGAGYLGGNWPSEPHYQQTGTRDYFHGDIAAVTYSYPGGP
jgi:Laminin G domain